MMLFAPPMFAGDIFCCLVVPLAGFGFFWFQLYRLRRTVPLQCAVCGQRLTRSTEEDIPSICSLCVVKGQFDNLSEDQREAFRRRAANATSTNIVKEDENRRGIVPRITQPDSDGIQQ